MALEDLQLDPYFLAKLFAQPIIPGKTEGTASPQKSLPKVKFLGENQKNVALFIQNENEPYLNDELFNLLTNILNACKLGMQDVALINISSYPDLSFADWQQAIKINQAVVFGIAPQQLAIDELPNYQLFTIDSSAVLFSDGLQIIGTDKTLKARLWAALKQLLTI
ncbi:hypothetical protein SAMN05444266_106175 [Chitinophaga jiangningensis]|uniref:Uncharacterized protein n=1 Tax=Chitinophaga jiangningensis TaxID=1419482 RepID=A0A1M7FL18_9BACT|nr:hypothetical protein [Chitinophaga jiangningensis]SHM04458.1 hypothetical protein SAMN05444266_106175 [Chitinophaga jiangningensis]